MADDVEDTLTERSGTHGLFSDNAQLAMNVRKIWRQSENWGNLSFVQQLALDEIALKVARILSRGAPVNLREPWHDIAGYARLAEKTIPHQAPVPKLEPVVTDRRVPRIFAED